MASLEHWSPEPGAKWQFHVDIIGTCNLACPSCPIGNLAEVKNPGGFMPPDLFERIVRKGVSECGRVDFGLYNWTEPFLHPDLPKMIRIVHSNGATCNLSTNLNRIKDLGAVLRENPREIKISLSGFSQDSYGRTHRKGDVEVVKKNMAELARSIEKTRSRTRISVGFHRYLGNHDDEFRMKEYSESLGFLFDPYWAYLMPLEKVMAFAEPDGNDVSLNDEDRRVIDLLALPLRGALEVSGNSPQKPCRLRDRQMAITVRGDAMLCCVVYDQEKYTLGPYLEQSLEELQEKKYRHWQCGPCMTRGLHKLFNYEDQELDRVALENVRRHHPDVRLPGMFEISRQRKHQGFRGVTRRVRNRVRYLFPGL